MGSSANSMMMAELPLGLSMGMGMEESTQPISMMMTDFPLGLFMILGRKTVPLAHLLN